MTWARAQRKGWVQVCERCAVKSLSCDCPWPDLKLRNWSQDHVSLFGKNKDSHHHLISEVWKCLTWLVGWNNKSRVRGGMVCSCCQRQLSFRATTISHSKNGIRIIVLVVKMFKNRKNVGNKEREVQTFLGCWMTFLSGAERDSRAQAAGLAAEPAPCSRERVKSTSGFCCSSVRQPGLKAGNYLNYAIDVSTAIKQTTALPQSIPLPKACKLSNRLNEWTRERGREGEGERERKREDRETPLFWCFEGSCTNCERKIWLLKCL